MKSFKILLSVIAVISILCIVGTCDSEYASKRQEQQKIADDLIKKTIAASSGSDGVWSVFERAQFLKAMGIDHTLQEGEILHIIPLAVGNTFHYSIKVTTFHHGGSTLMDLKLATREDFENYFPPSTQEWTE